MDKTNTMDFTTGKIGLRSKKIQWLKWLEVESVIGGYLGLSILVACRWGCLVAAGLTPLSSDLMETAGIVLDRSIMIFADCPTQKCV